MSSKQPLRHNDYLDHILEASGLIRSYVEGFSKADFLADRRTQQAIILKGISNHSSHRRRPVSSQNKGAVQRTGITAF